MDFSQFLSIRSDKNYVFQNTSYEEQIKNASSILNNADTVLIGAGSGLSTAAGIIYNGKRFTDNFGEFIDKYGSTYMSDMYTAGFYPFPSEEAKWGYWSKHAYMNRIEPESLPLYKKLYKIVENKNYFVLTTNVDHQFWKAGFEDRSIFAVQGDYGRIQCSKGCHDKTYDAVDMFKQMNQERKDCLIPSYMVPKCTECGGNMDMHLRKDSFFVEDEYWHNSANHYSEFLSTINSGKVVLLELGVGFNTPAIIRFPFEKMVREHKNLSLIRLNLSEAFIPQSIEDRAIGINADISKSINDIAKAIN